MVQFVFVYFCSLTNLAESFLPLIPIHSTVSGAQLAIFQMQISEFNFGAQLSTVVSSYVGRLGVMIHCWKVQCHTKYFLD